MIILAICYVLLGIIAVVILIDIIPIFKDWVNRIHIGRYDDKDIWKRSITSRGIKWLNSTPKIKVTDNSRWIVLDMLKGNYTKSAIQHWQEAALLLGLAEYSKYHIDHEVKNEMMKFLNNTFDSDGQWIVKPKNIDAAILAYAVIKLNVIHAAKYRKAFDAVFDLIKEHIGKDGTVKYRKSMENYRYVDTIGFICPFLVAYGLEFRNEESIDLAVKQIKEYEQYGILEKYHLPSHAYMLENKVPLGLYGWGRGLGWFAIGIIDSWKELPSDHKYKPVLEETVRRYAKAFIRFQQADGSWNWTVTRSESRPDSSATATLGWFMVNASQLKDISKDCLESADKAIGYLMKVTRRNGAVDFSQGDTKDIGVYSMLYNILPFTQGFCIRTINCYENYGAATGMK